MYTYVITKLTIYKDFLCVDTREYFLFTMTFIIPFEIILN